MDPFEMTRQLIKDEFRPALPPGVSKAWTVAAYSSADTFRRDVSINQSDRRVRLATLLSYRFFTPTKSDPKHEMLQRAVDLANTDAFPRAQIPVVVEVLRSQGIGILGGELWWVRDGFTDWVGAIPQRHGPPGVYVWETKREPGEPWPHFIERGASDALAAVDRWPTPSDLPPDLPGRILYNLTWGSEAEFKKLGTKTV